MTSGRTLSRLGLAMRAGKLVSGEETVHKAIRGGEARLVVLAGDASPGTRKKLTDKCASFGVPLVVGFTRYELGGAVGKPERVMFAVTDEGLARLIASGFRSNSEVENIE